MERSQEYIQTISSVEDMPAVAKDIVTTYCTHNEIDEKDIYTSVWDDIIDNIIANNTKNVIIVSDRDLDYADTPPLKVDGIVCFLWKYGEFATEPVKRLQGRQGTYQYSFE